MIGYLHTGIEKSCEAKTYSQGITLTDRIDYLAPLSNNLGYCLAVEKLLGLEVPKRAQYIRVLLTELTRIASHLVWLGTHAIDLGAMTVFLYSFREREEIMKIFEYRLRPADDDQLLPHRRPGARTAAGLAGSRSARDRFPARPHRRIRRPAHAKPHLAGPHPGRRASSAPPMPSPWAFPARCCAAAAWPTTCARRFPYSSYDEFDFDVQTQTAGDCYARYQVRVAEIRESIKIVSRPWQKIPAEGPFRAEAPGIIPPSREEMKTSIEGLIYHFKIFTEGFAPPPGEVYQAIESPRGELGVFIASDGSAKPYRVKFRAPSFVNLQSLPKLAEGRLIADVVACIGTTDIVLGEVDR